MSRAGAFTSSMYQRHGAYHLPDADRAPQTTGGSTQVIVGLNALSLLLVMGWMVFARLRRRVLRTIFRFLATCLPPCDGGSPFCLNPVRNQPKVDKVAAPAVSGEDAGLIDADAAGDGDDEAEDVDLEGYEIIRRGDAVESDFDECSSPGQPD